MADTITEASFPVSKRNRVVRRGQRGRYDKKSVYDILDASMFCHVAYVIDGQPYCTPTAFWREGDNLYWHGSSASRMLRNQAKGIPVCLTVTHVDSLVLARCGFNHSVNYRSAMAYGTAALVDDPAEKARAADAFLDRFYPGRSALMREATAAEMKATSFVGMAMEQASGKIRDTGLSDDEADYAHPAWTAELKLRTVLDEIAECPRQLPGLSKPEAMADWVPGRSLDEIMLATARRFYGEET